jgi:hypothetical protein
LEDSHISAAWRTYLTSNGQPEPGKYHNAVAVCQVGTPIAFALRGGALLRDVRFQIRDGSDVMSSLQQVEQLFKMRHEFKECRLPRDQQSAQLCGTSEDSATKVTELIQKLKGQIEPLQH